MRKFTIFILCCFVIPAWAVPSLTDLDSWQLPEDEPANTQREVPANSAVKKTKKKKSAELKVQLSENNAYTLSSSTKEADAIVVMAQSAQQLLSKLKGKTRFDILFNANMPTTVDKVMVAQDDKEYAVAIFGEENHDYRLLLFKNDVEQPLLDTAEDIRGKLVIYQKYKLDTGINEEEMERTYPEIIPQKIKSKEDGTEYHAYQLEGPLFAVFKEGKIDKLFTNQKEFDNYSSQLEGENAAPAIVTPEKKPKTEKKISETPKQAKPKRLFSEIVNGPKYMYSGHHDRFKASGSNDFNRFRPDEEQFRGPSRRFRNRPDRFQKPSDPYFPNGMEDPSLTEERIEQSADSQTDNQTSVVYDGNLTRR